MFFSTLKQIEAQKNKALSVFMKTRDILSDISFRSIQAIEKNETIIANLKTENNKLNSHVEEMGKSIKQISIILGDE